MAGSENRYRAFLEGLGRERLRRGLIPVAARDARSLTIGGRTYINLASNDYLALRFHDALTGRAADWARDYGTGSAASRLVTGHLDLFERIEGRIARLKGKPAALLMASGFQANATVLQALFDKTVLGAEPLVFADRLNHASMHFGCKAAGVRQIRYRHGDADHLEELLTQHKGEHRPKFILTESVFSMDGDVAPLGKIAALSKAHEATLIVDDAHGTGILGPGGRGMSEEADLVIGTFSKALGSFGAFVAGSEVMRDYLVNRASGFVYSTALPPPVLGAIDAALDLLPELDGPRAHVARLAAAFRQGAQALGYETGASTTQIVPLMAGSAEAALGISETLRAAGVWATAIRPPTVPQGSARVRFAFTAAHSDADVARLHEALQPRVSFTRTKAASA